MERLEGSGAAGNGVTVSGWRVVAPLVPQICSLQVCCNTGDADLVDSG